MIAAVLGNRAETHRTNTALLGMVIFMASWAMLFAGLFFAYGLLRFRAAPSTWPPADLPRVPLPVPILATVVLAMSSLLGQRALSRVRAGLANAHVHLLAATGTGALFLACQILVWRRQWAAGVLPSTGSYASVFYTLTVFHSLHVLVGLCALTWIAARAARAAYSPAAHIPVRLWTLYWHMVGIIWGLMFILLYLT